MMKPKNVTRRLHRCHKREFLLKFSRDRRRWIEWLYEAKKRYSGLSVLNYAHAKWVDSTIQTNHSDKEKKWTQSLAA
jgi:hypothetical protein